MNKKGIYSRLAIGNIKKNSSIYIPFILTCIGTIAMFFNGVNLLGNPSIHGSVKFLMTIGVWVTAIFSAIFLLYTNSFITKRRKKEFGLYNILGMDKKHIGVMNLWENLYVFTLSIILGLGIGVLFAKLITLILYKLLRFNPNMPFILNLEAVIYTAILFGFIFILLFIYNMLHILRLEPIELINDSKAGEAEPKSNRLVTLLGIATLLSGYGIALYIKDPVKVILLFFLAVLLVIIGTYCLFTSGSIAILKALKRNKKYYYNTKHFISVSGLIYRMKQNAIGLSNICIMSTAVLVMLSTTVALYSGLEDSINARYKNDITLSGSIEINDDFDIDRLYDIVEEKAKAYKVSSKNTHHNVYSLIYCDVYDNSFKLSENSSNFSIENSYIVYLIEEYEFNRLTGKSLNLSADSIALCSQNDLNYKNINLLGKEFLVKEVFNRELDLLNKFNNISINTVYIVYKDNNVLEELSSLMADSYTKTYKQLEMGFDIDLDYENIVELVSDILDGVGNGGFEYESFGSMIKEDQRTDYYNAYGMLLFLGIFLGTLFLMATVLIIYYKQIVEGFEDRKRYETLKSIGIDYTDIKHTINSQILLVFALPIVSAIVHIIVATPILIRLLAMLGLTNVGLFIVCAIVTVLVFCLGYIIVYFKTAKVYLKIVG